MKQPIYVIEYRDLDGGGNGIEAVYDDKDAAILSVAALTEKHPKFEFTMRDTLMEVTTKQQKVIGVLGKLTQYVKFDNNLSAFVPVEPYALSFGGSFLNSIAFDTNGELILSYDKGIVESVDQILLNQIDVWKCDLVA